jgi:hypothetical protein
MAREIVRSRQYTWSNGARLPIDTSFLDATLAKYSSPVVEALYLRFVGSVTANNGVTFSQRDSVRALAQQFVWKDKRGERINLTGDELRLAAQMELGAAYQDASAINGSGGTTTNTSYEIIVPITFAPPRSRRRADFRPGVAEFTSGDIIWTLGATNPVTSVVINSGTVELHALVTDEVVPEAASRMCWISQAAQLAEDNYMIDGALRAAFMHAPTAAGFSSLATFTEIDSYTLSMVDVPRTLLREKYRHEGSFSPDSTNDEIVNNNVIPLVYPDRDQKITSMSGVNKLHVRLQAALPSGGRLVYCAITDRDPVLTAAVLKTPLGELANVPMEVNTQKGRKNADALPVELARKLPVSVG